MTLLRFLFFTPFFAVGIAFIHAGRKRLKQADQVLRWSRVPGKVLASGMVKESDPDRDSPGSTFPFYQVEVSYSYEAGGASRRGSRISFGYAATKKREIHERLLANLSPGTAIHVYVDPLDPDESALSAERDASWFWFGCIWTAGTAVACLLALLTK